VGNIVGNIKTAEIAKKQQQSLDNEKAYSESLFNKEYYQEELNRSENASYLRQLQNNQNENNVKAQRTAAITGATPEATATQSKNAGSVYANAVNKMAGVASQRKDQALARYGARRSALVGAQNGIYESKKNAWGTFMGNASRLGSGALSNTSSPLAEETKPLIDTGTIVEETPNFA
ncbi:MAG: hypothetical protein JZU53_07025, partial [Paludibacter sp.]|nr:hypothetical protein [Paludibacter sp.]